MFPNPVYQLTALSIPLSHPHHHLPKSKFINTGLDCFLVCVPLSGAPLAEPSCVELPDQVTLAQNSSGTL